MTIAHPHNIEKHILLFPAAIVLFGRSFTLTGQIDFHFNTDLNTISIDRVIAQYGTEIIDLTVTSEVSYIQSCIWDNRDYWNIEDYWWFTIDNVIDLEETTNQ